jgi:hypothetical protein
VPLRCIKKRESDVAAGTSWKLNGSAIPHYPLPITPGLAINHLYLHVNGTAVHVNAGLSVTPAAAHCSRHVVYRWIDLRHERKENWLLEVRLL